MKAIRKQVKKAATALLGHLEAKRKKSGKRSLFSEGVEAGDHIQLIVGLRRTPEQGKTKPIPLDIPHSLYRVDHGASMCLFVKDNDKELEEQLSKNPVEGLTRVVSLGALRRKYKQFQERRKLVAAHQLFLADDRIIPMLTKTLGKIFLKRKKQPVAVRLTKGSIPQRVAAARDRTYMFLGWGACTSIRIARTDFTAEQVVENALAAIKGFVAKRKWKHIQSMHIKSTDSVALPIYNALPEAISRDDVGQTDSEVVTSTAAAPTLITEENAAASDSRAGKRRKKSGKRSR